jgi:hypothetical protein
MDRRQDQVVIIEVGRVSKVRRAVGWIERYLGEKSAPIRIVGSEGRKVLNVTQARLNIVVGSIEDCPAEIREPIDLSRGSWLVRTITTTVGEHLAQ